MVHTAPILFSAKMVTTRCGRLLLSIPLCVVLFGCESSSPISTSETTTQPSTENRQAPLTKNDQTTPPTDNDEPITQPINEKTEDAGQSLMAAAKSDDSSRARAAPMISEQPDSNALQATLIGDYMGMLPCATCDSIAVTLNLFSDGSVLKTSIYNDADSPQAPIIESGIYRQDDDTITIAYDKNHLEIYHIQDNHLVMMDKENAPNTDHILSRQ